MAEFVSEFFDRVIPGAAGHGEQFLKLIRERAELDVPYALRAAQSGKSARLVLQAGIAGGRLEVFADDVARSLHAGWMLITARSTSMLAATSLGQSLQGSRDIREASPDFIRTGSALIGVLHVAVFLPTLEQLAESVAYTRSVRGPSGFFGA